MLPPNLCRASHALARAKSKILKGTTSFGSCERHHVVEHVKHPEQTEYSRITQLRRRSTVLRELTVRPPGICNRKHLSRLRLKLALRSVSGSSDSLGLCRRPVRRLGVACALVVVWLPARFGSASTGQDLFILRRLGDVLVACRIRCATLPGARGVARRARGIESATARIS